MRLLVIALLGVGIVTAAGYALLFTGTTMEVVTPKIERVEVEKKVTIDALEVRIKEAQEDARADIDAKLEVYRTELLTEIADEVKREYIKEVEASISSESY